MREFFHILALPALFAVVSCSMAESFDYEARADYVATNDMISSSGGGVVKDSGFKAFCIENYDADGDGSVTAEEVAGVTDIDCSGRSIRSLDGISSFKALETLVCDNNSLTSIDFSKMPQTLRSLSCKGNLIRELNLCDFPLQFLRCNPMNDASGQNVLQFIYVRQGHIFNVLDIPDDTYVIELP